MNEIKTEIPEGATHYGVNKYWNYTYYKNITESSYRFYSNIDNKWHDTTGEPLFDVKPIPSYTPTVGEECECVAKDGTIIKVLPLFWDGGILVVKIIEHDSYFGSLTAKYRAIKPKWYEHITTPVKCVVWDDELYWQVDDVGRYNSGSLNPFMCEDGEAWKYAHPVNDSTTLAEIEAIVRGR